MSCSVAAPVSNSTAPGAGSYQPSASSRASCATISGVA